MAQPSYFSHSEKPYFLYLSRENWMVLVFSGRADEHWLQPAQDSQFRPWPRPDLVQLGPVQAETKSRPQDQSQAQSNARSNPKPRLSPRPKLNVYLPFWGPFQGWSMPQFWEFLGIWRPNYGLYMRLLVLFFFFFYHFVSKYDSCPGQCSRPYRFLAHLWHV